MARPSEILLVEDNPADTRFTMEAHQEAKVRNKVMFTDHDVMALQISRREDTEAHRPTPDMALPDPNLPAGGR